MDKAALRQVKRMGKIAFIAPYEEIFTIGQRVIADLGLTGKIDCYLGWLKKGVEFARQAEADGVDVIVSRGGTAELILKSGVQVPIVEIPISVQDLAETLLAAKKVTGNENPRVAVLAFRNMIQSLEVFTKVMDISLVTYEINSEEEIAPSVERALREKADVVIGGIHTTTLALARGMKTVLLASGEESYRVALLQAEKLSYARTLEKERMQKFRVLVDYSIQGIIGIDNDKRISVFNNAAERLLGLSSDQAIGKSVDTILAGLPLAACLDEAKTITGELVQANHKKLMTNLIPIDVGGTLSGAMITIEDVGQIVEMEAAIRSEIYSKGHSARYHFEDIYGSSQLITEAKRIAREYATIDATVLITGASGTGKEMFAQSIHNASSRHKRPFVAVNCGAIPSSLLESELFGYVEGAFTGATKKGKPGYFELAHGGTIFLDEIGEMEKLAQTSLLRVIQERRVMRLGGDKYLPIDVRIIAATNKELMQLVKEGKLREDLYYRINVLPLDLPVLKDRPTDAIFIAEHFLAEFNKRFGRKVSFNEQAKAYISSCEWPGNIRELRNYVERLVVTGKQDIATSGAKKQIPGSQKDDKSSPDSQAMSENSEQAKILQILNETNYNQKEAAKRLGIDRSTLYRKLKAYHIGVKKLATRDA